MRKIMVVFSIAASLSATSVMANDDEDYTQGAAAQRFLSGIGLVDPKKPEIEYRARPSLVIPPSVDQLPTPSASAASTTPNWPKDEQTLAKKRARDMQAMPFGEREKMRGIPEGGNTRLSLDEMRAGRVAGAGIVDRPDQSMQTQSPYISPEELKKQGVALKQTPLGVEPERKWLTDPPSGYRKGSTYAGKLDEPEKKSFFSRLNPFN